MAVTDARRDFELVLGGSAQAPARSHRRHAADPPAEIIANALSQRDVAEIAQRLDKLRSVHHRLSQLDTDQADPVFLQLVSDQIRNLLAYVDRKDEPPLP